VKVALIIPVAHLEEFEPLTDIDFVLPHMVIDSVAYTRFYKASKRFKIMDNSAWELKKPLSFDRVLEIGRNVAIDEIILSDIPYKKNESYKLTRDTLSTLSNTDRRHFRFMAVPQGKNPFDLVEMYPKYTELNVDTIGITRFSCSTNPFDRIVAVRLLHLKGLWNDQIVHHLLGLDNPVELLSHREWFRSVDTRWPLKYAVRNGEFDQYQMTSHRTPFTDKKAKRFDPYSKLKWWEIAKAKHNAEVLRRFAHD